MSVGRGRQEQPSMPDHREIFTSVYTDNLWAAESRSGEGSTVEAATAIVREIPYLFQRINVRTMLDIPCGDLHWMQHLDLGATDYTGADIVESLIENNNYKFGHPGRRFQVMDLISGPLPKVDLILSRDCLIHLTVPMIFSCLNSIVQSGSEYLLTSHYPWRGYLNNEEVDGIILGGRRINLEADPFNFPPPLYSIPEAEKLTIAADKSLCLWRIETLAEPLRLAKARYDATQGQ
jgi:hypothetical protein